MTDSIMSSWAGIGGRLRAACLPVHRGDLGEPHDDAVLRGQRPTRLFNRDPRERRRHHEQRSLIERRHELGPESLKHRHGRDHEQDRGGDDDDPESDDQHRNWPVDGGEQPADGIGRLGAEPALQQEHHQRRGERDREHRGGEHRERLRVGERHEQSTRLAGQREDGQEADGDQQQREEDRPADLLARVDDDPCRDPLRAAPPPGARARSRSARWRHPPARRWRWRSRRAT